MVKQHTRRAVLGVAAGTISAGLARAQPARGARKQLRLGIMSDLSGPYADLSLPGEACARQAIADFGAASRGWDVDVLVVDHQNKADIAVATARRWFDQEGLDALVDVSTSATALAVNGLVRERNKVLLVSQAGTSGANLTERSVRFAPLVFAGGPNGPNARKSSVRFGPLAS